MDICGLLVLMMCGDVEVEVYKSNFGWLLVYVEENLVVMLIGFMLSNRDDAVIWRGSRKNGLIK